MTAQIQWRAAPALEPYSMLDARELPANVADWAVDPDRAVLLIHDMQRYFVEPIPAAPRDELIANTVVLRDRAVALGMPVAYSTQPGGMTEQQRGLLRDFWGPGMRVDPTHRRVVPALTPRRDDWVLTKWRYSAFFRSDLLVRMRARGRDQLVICGVYAHVGVLMTAVDAYTNDVQPFLVADAVADFSADYHRMALDYAAQRCAMVLPTEGVLP